MEVGAICASWLAATYPCGARHNWTAEMWDSRTAPVGYHKWAVTHTPHKQGTKWDLQKLDPVNRGPHCVLQGNRKIGRSSEMVGQ